MKKKITYIYPVLAKKIDLGFLRFFSAGLGNSLFIWARAQLLKKKYKLRLITPAWVNFKIGPILRGDFSNHTLLNSFKTNVNDLNGFTKLFILIFKKKISLQTFLKNKSICFNKIILINQEINYNKNNFRFILKNYNYIKKELLKITKKKKLNKIQFRNSISLHIRRGDFVFLKNTTSIIWFKKIIVQLRKKTNNNLKVYIFGDCKSKEICPLMKLDNVERIITGSPLTDLILLSKSKILVGSKNSTFSQWASYLGRMPVIWPKGSLKNNRLYLEKDNCEIESDGNYLPKKFIQILKKSIM